MHVQNVHSIHHRWCTLSLTDLSIGTSVIPLLCICINHMCFLFLTCTLSNLDGGLYIIAIQARIYTDINSVKIHRSWLGSLYRTDYKLLKRSGVTQRMFGSLCCPDIWVLSFSLFSIVLLFFTSTSSFYYAVLVHIFGLRNCAFLPYMQNHISVRTGEDCLSCLALVSLLCLWHICVPIYINTINTKMYVYAPAGLN